MTPTFLRVEQVSLVAPLGIRFWDAVTGALIEGLSVNAAVSDQTDQRYAAYMTPSAVYAFRNLPGLRATESGEGDAAFWSGSPPSRVLRIEVRDPLQRYLPCHFEAVAPTRGLFHLTCLPPAWPPSIPVVSPPGGYEGVPLFSAPSRLAPAGLACIRAELRNAQAVDTRTGEFKPAAWAMLEASYQGSLVARGLADAQGRVTLILPYPELGLTSPVGRVGLTGQRWTLQLAAYYTWVEPVPATPVLCGALSQAPAPLLNTLSPPTPLPDQTLRYGAELIVHSQARSEVLVAPAGSPP